MTSNKVKPQSEGIKRELLQVQAPTSRAPQYPAKRQWGWGLEWGPWMRQVRWDSRRRGSEPRAERRPGAPYAISSLPTRGRPPASQSPP